MNLMRGLLSTGLYVSGKWQLASDFAGVKIVSSYEVKGLLVLRVQNAQNDQF